jgi:hypothetical protein
VSAGGDANHRTISLPGPLVPLIVGAVGLLACALYGLVSPASFFRAYLISFLLWVGIPLGALALVEIGRLTGGAWADQLRPVLGPASRTIPLLALLFLPLLLGLPLLFPWANAEAVQSNLELAAKTKYYLNVPGFLVRAAFYFLVWIGFAFWITWPRRAGSADPRPTPPVAYQERRRLGIRSAVGLVLFGFTVTFASIDWAMSLEPEPKWFSTIYGVMWAVGMILSAFSFGVAVVGRFSPHADQQVLRDLGNLMMAFTLMWAYLAFSQFMLIWAGNLREEVTWYARRGTPLWADMAFVLVFGQFAVPFAVLLSGVVKTNARSLMVVALLVFLMRFLDVFWLVAPAFFPADPDRFWDSADLFWLTPLAFVGIGGLWVACFLWLRPTTVPDPAPAATPEGEPAHE